jgi:pyruvate dehydrogenase E1 component alpha subunit
MLVSSLRNKLLEWFRRMLLIRRFEEEAANLYRQGHIGGFCHLYIGQEAVAVGCYGALQTMDTVITAYRDHGHILACGTDPRKVMAELTGRKDGCSLGKGGSMHMFDPEKGFYGGHGIVGAQIPLGTGMAFAHKYTQDGGICVAFMGDGAANQGQVYEAMNMAVLWNLPVIYVIENNGYGMGTSEKRACAGPGLYTRGQGFGIPGERIDGMNVEIVYEAFSRICEQVRREQKPFLLEMDTYRYRGHSMSDPAKYRNREEVSLIREQRDPLTTCLESLKTTYDKEYDAIALQNEIEFITQNIDLQIQDAVDFSLLSSEPPLSMLDTHVFEENDCSPYKKSMIDNL